MKRIEAPKTDVYPEATSDQYASWDARSFGYLKLALRSPMHALHYRLNPTEPTAAMIFGQQLHVAVLEPDIFAASYVQAPSFNRKSSIQREKEKEWFADAQEKGHEPVTAENWDTIAALKDSLWAQYPELLAGPGVRELAGVWRDYETKQTCKLKVDLLAADWEGGPAVVDLKTCQDASEDATGRALQNQLYHMQMAFYLDGLHNIAPAGRAGMLLMVEKAPPYAAGLWEIEEETLDVGRALYERGLSILAKCEEENRWPGYTDGEAGEVSLSNWAKNKELGSAKGDW